MASEDEDVNRRELVDESIALKLLTDAGSDGRDGEGDRVHGLDLRGLDEQKTPESALYPRMGPNCPHRLLGSRETNRANPFPVGCQHLTLRVLPVARCDQLAPVGSSPKSRRSHCRVVMANWVGVIAMAGNPAGGRWYLDVVRSAVRLSFLEWSSSSEGQHGPHGKSLSHSTPPRVPL